MNEWWKALAYQTIEASDSATCLDHEQVSYMRFDFRPATTVKSSCEEMGQAAFS